MKADEFTGRDPRWQFWSQGKPELESRLGTTFAISNGYLGMRGSPEEMPKWGRPEFYISGTYTGGPPSLLGFHDPDHILTHPKRITGDGLQGLSNESIPTLPNFPHPLAVRLSVGGVPFTEEQSKVLANERVLEIDKGLLRRRLVFRDQQGRRTCVDSQRLASFADRNLIVMRYTITPLDHEAKVQVAAYLKKDVTSPGGVVLWTELQARTEAMRDAVECMTKQSKIKVSIAQQAKVYQQGKATVLDLFVIAGELAFDQAIARARAAAAKGFDALRDEHLSAWNRELDGARVEMDADVPTVQGFNFSQMHLHMALGEDCNRFGIPIKGLTGSGYRFCNFWDMDFHMYPYYLLTKPQQAHKLLEYRYSQLDAYRRNARHWGAQGAQVPWETQVTGEEATAPWLCLQEREIHISADAARMFVLYDELTGNHEPMVRMGAEFILETARFYASRMRWMEEKQKFGLPDIGCPDQYHTFADNNHFISRMARWNLQYAVAVAEDPQYQHAVRRIGLKAEEVSNWKQILSKFYIIEPNEEAIIEEFDGFFDLEASIDGACETFCRHSQAVKQTDVLLAFGPFEELYPLEIRRKNWEFYAKRTTHGSSLSLPGMAWAAARCGLNDEALYCLQKSARMDLDDVNLDTERGAHVSGGAVQWYAVVFGFGGLTPRREYLQFDPNLPRQWDHLAFTVHWRMQRVNVRLTKKEITFSVGRINDQPVAIKLKDQPVFTVAPGEARTIAL